MVAAWFSTLSLRLQQWKMQPVAGQPPPPPPLPLLQHQDRGDKSRRALCCIFKLAARCAACLVITHAGEGGGRGGGGGGCGVYGSQTRYVSVLAVGKLDRVEDGRRRRDLGSSGHVILDAGRSPQSGLWSPFRRRLSARLGYAHTRTELDARVTAGRETGGGGAWGREHWCSCGRVSGTTARTRRC